MNSGNQAWRKTIEKGGWDIPDSKSPLPADATCLLGADVRHTMEGSELDVAETRAHTISELTKYHLRSDRLSAGAAGKFHGRL